MSGARAYLIDALLAEGFSKRTILYYINIGVLPHAIGRGPSAYYTDQHLAILREVKATRAEARSLADLRAESQKRFPHLFKQPANPPRPEQTE